MIRFTCTICQFEKQGEKTGWTYVPIPAETARQLLPGCRKSFKVKGRLDDQPVSQLTLLPMGEGDFILPLNGTLRKLIRKRKGDTLTLHLAVDETPYELNADLVACLADEPEAMAFFQSKPPYFRVYYSKWVESAKTEATRSKRIAMAVSALARRIEFGEMLRMQRDQKG